MPCLYLSSTSSFAIKLRWKDIGSNSHQSQSGLATPFHMIDILRCSACWLPAYECARPAPYLEKTPDQYFLHRNFVLLKVRQPGGGKFKQVLLEKRVVVHDVLLMNLKSAHTGPHPHAHCMVNCMQRICRCTYFSNIQTNQTYSLQVIYL